MINAFNRNYGQYTYKKKNAYSSPTIITYID